ncbi:MAG: hypothetical protein IT183_06600 [Acidobacteria bacterium]|nr:hypothetical protein [Acidobacteriota bacterium]
MKCRDVRALASSALCALAMLATPDVIAGTGQAPGLDRLLAMAAAHVEQYTRGMSNVVAEEDYQQIVREDSIHWRRTRADMIVFDVAGNGWWVPLRDVFEVDGQPVRERDDRLARLAEVFSSNADAVAQARAISEESARFNLGGFGLGVHRTINTPMTALAFLSAVNQPRSTFSVEGTEVIDGIACRVVTFAEVQEPSLIESLDGIVQAGGRFWIEPVSGRVLRAELLAATTLARDRTRSVRGRITTTYVEEGRLSIWVPVRMDEHYDVIRGPVTSAIDGRADYSNFRRFGVSTSEQTR